MKNCPLITDPRLSTAIPAELSQYTADRQAEGINAPVCVYTGANTGKAFKNYIKGLGAVDSIFLLGDLPGIGYSWAEDSHIARRNLGDYILVSDEDFGWIDDNTALQGFMTRNEPYAAIGRIWFENLPNVPDPIDAYRRYLKRRHEMAYWKYPLRLDWVNHLQGQFNCADADILRQMGSLSQIARRLGGNIIDDGAYGNDGTWDTEKTDGAQIALWFSGGSEIESAFYYIGTDARELADEPQVMFATFFGSYLCDYYAQGNLLRTYLSGNHGLVAAYNHYNALPIYRLAEGWSWGQVCKAGAIARKSPLCNLLGDPS